MDKNEIVEIFTKDRMCDNTPIDQCYPRCFKCPYHVTEEELGEAIDVVLSYWTPMLVQFRLNESGDSPYMEGICPRCHGEEGLYDRQDYCSECGQALKWPKIEG